TIFFPSASRTWRSTNGSIIFFSRAIFRIQRSDCSIGVPLVLENGIACQFVFMLGFSSMGFIESTWAKPDQPFEIPLRPQTLSDFAGQELVRKRLDVAITAALGRNDPLGHSLFSGPP